MNWKEGIVINWDGNDMSRRCFGEKNRNVLDVLGDIFIGYLKRLVGRRV